MCACVGAGARSESAYIFSLREVGVNDFEHIRVVQLLEDLQLPVLVPLILKHLFDGNRLASFLDSALFFIICARARLGRVKVLSFPQTALPSLPCLLGAVRHVERTRRREENESGACAFACSPRPPNQKGDWWLLGFDKRAHTNQLLLLP